MERSGIDLFLDDFKPFLAKKELEKAKRAIRRHIGKAVCGYPGLQIIVLEELPEDAWYLVASASLAKEIMQMGWAKSKKKKRRKKNEEHNDPK
jgi:hypothetical protein